MESPLEGSCKKKQTKSPTNHIKDTFFSLLSNVSCMLQFASSHSAPALQVAYTLQTVLFHFLSYEF